MKHPNTFAALVAYGATFATQWLVARYAHVQLSDGWKQTVDGGVTASVLWIGKEGVKAALQRVWNGPKKIWAGATKKTASTSTAKATS